MYATAHRVAPPPGRAGVEGINVFVNIHGHAFPWPPDPWNLPGRDPGVEVEVLRRIAVPPGGNSVRSFLDVLCPDECAWDEVAAALTGLWLEIVSDDATPAAVAGAPNPAIFQRGRVTLRFGTDDILAANRSLELQELQAALEPVRLRDQR